MSKPSRRSIIGSAKWLSVVSMFGLITILGCSGAVAQTFKCPIEDYNSGMCDKGRAGGDKECLYPNPPSTVTYWICDGQGKATLLTCTTNTHWDDTKKECEFNSE